MAILAKQTIPDEQKQMLECVSKATGNPISTVVRDIFKRENERLLSEAFQALTTAIDNEVV